MTLAKYLYGRLTGFGIMVALATGVIDQAVKLTRETNGVKDVQSKLTISEKAEKKAEKKGY